MQNSRLLFIVSISALFLSACKKNKDIIAATPPPAAGNSAGTVSSLQIKDSVLLLAKDIYLWNTQIPSGFSVQNYSDPAAIMTAIRPYSIEQEFSTAVDKWSFAMKKAEWNQMSGGTSTLSATTGNGDFGFSVFFRAEDDLRVRLVEPNSPAGQAGIHRSWRVTAINGNSNITTGIQVLL